jgi:hypothetical protein
MRLLKWRQPPITPQISDDVRQILHRVGLAVLVFGLLDIGLMIYCIANDVSYSSSFNIFAVISGIYLYRGHPWYVTWVTRAAGFYVAAFCTMLLISPFLFPVDLGLLQLRLHPVDTVVDVLITIGVVIFLMWVYRELRQTPVLTTFTAAGNAPGTFWAAPLCGAILVIGAGLLFFVLMHGDEAQRAIGIATVKTGPGYRYYVTRLSYSGDRGSAAVLAYDDKATKSVQVEW